MNGSVDTRGAAAILVGNADSGPDDDYETPLKFWPQPESQDSWTSSDDGDLEPPLEAMSRPALEDSGASSADDDLEKPLEAKPRPASQGYWASSADDENETPLEAERPSSDAQDITVDELEYNKFAADFHADAHREPRSSNALEYPEAMSEPRSSDYWLQLGESVRNSRFSNRRFNRSSLIAPRSSDYIDNQEAQVRSSAHFSTDSLSLSDVIEESTTKDQRSFPEPMNTPAYDIWMSERMNRATTQRLQLELIDLIRKIVHDALIKLPIVHDRAHGYESMTFRNNCSKCLEELRYMLPVMRSPLPTARGKTFAIWEWKERFLPYWTFVMKSLASFHELKRGEIWILLQPLPVLCEKAQHLFIQLDMEIRSSDRAT
jgi:hypothetical protein